MKYQFEFYKESDAEEVEQLIIKGYEWEYPIFGLSRYEFAKELHPCFTELKRVWERTEGVFREKGRIIACAINEGTEESDVFFLFDSKERATEIELLEEMIYFAKTTMSSVEANQTTRYVNLRIPKWNQALREVAQKLGFIQTSWDEKIYIHSFEDEKREALLPEGYTLVDGETTPDFYLANIHMAAFNYDIGARKRSEEAFRHLRTMKYYNKKLDLCILDPMKRPVAMAVIWYDERMPYCELDPLGVVWWERRKHLGTALLNEAELRIKKLYPNCKGMLGGNQIFYEKIGYEKKAEVPIYRWEIEIYPSWDKKSQDRYYHKEI